ncbi:hypothetical protein [Marinicellulosiphila megalodicopiae]|uniref:hypothetical protein n=1 Tax=Marinicellulosiphila megalodicopiae TaxID=2724896 RepID=UPI003BAFF13A
MKIKKHSNIDQSIVDIGILLHLIFSNEIAFGVVVAREILYPTSGDQNYNNSQIGETSTTNPSPSIISEQLIF